MLTFYDFGGGVTYASIIRAAGTQAITTTGQVIEFPTRVSGSAGVFDSPTSTLTPKAGTALVRLAVGIVASDIGGYTRANSVKHTGSVHMHGATGGYRGVWSAILAVGTPQSYAFWHSTNSTSTTIDAGSWFAIEEMASASYTLCTKTANQSIGTGFTTITFDNEIADTDNAHSNVTNNSRFTTPTGMAFGRMSMGLALAGAGGINRYTFAAVAKNGVRTFDGCGMANHESVVDIGVVGCIVPMTASTDYFEAQAAVEVARNVLGGATESWAQVEWFATGHQFAAARPNATQSLTANVLAQLTLGTNISDAHGIRSGNTFVVPSGATEARMSYNLYFGGTTAQCYSRGRIDGVAFIPGMPSGGGYDSGSDEEIHNAAGAWVPVTPGQVLDLAILCNASITRPNTNLTWVCVEFR